MSKTRIKSNFKSVSDLNQDLINKPIINKNNIESKINTTQKQVNPNKITKFTLDNVQELYDKARFQKIYGIETDLEQIIPRNFYLQLIKIIEEYPNDFFEIKAIFFRYDDLGNKLTGYYQFIQKISNIMYYKCYFNIENRNSIHTEIKIYCPAKVLKLVIKYVSMAHQVIISHKDGFKIEFYDKNLLLQEKIIKFENSFQKGYSINKYNFLKEIDIEDYSKLASGIFSWVKNKTATTVKIITTKNGNEELRYYRNSYKERIKKKIIYNDENDVLYQILINGAFTFIADSHYEYNKTILGNYLGTIDIDIHHAEYYELLNRVDEFYNFLQDIVHINPVITTSGNKSFHFKFFLGEFKENQVGMLLPKLLSWDTFYRRRRDELNILMIRNALDILTLAYIIDYSKLEPVCCNFPKYNNRARYKFFFDNRTGIHQGARVPGSIHHKSNRVARVFNYSEIPKTEAILKSVTSFDYIFKKPDVIQCPKISDEEMDKNLEKLLNFSNNYYNDNLNTLIYQKKVYN